MNAGGFNSLAAAWPEKEYVKAAREAKEAIRKGLFLPPKRKVPADVITWQHRVRRMHEVAAGGGRVKAAPLARVLSRIR